MERVTEKVISEIRKSVFGKEKRLRLWILTNEGPTAFWPIGAIGAGYLHLHDTSAPDLLPGPGSGGFAHMYICKNDDELSVQGFTWPMYRYEKPNDDMLRGAWTVSSHNMP